MGCDVVFHLQRMKELMGMDQNQFRQALTCEEGLSLSLLSNITHGDPEGYAFVTNPSSSSSSLTLHSWCQLVCFTEGGNR